MSKIKTTEPSSFPENWVRKVGDVLIAIDPCVMNDEDGEEALTVGKEYSVNRVEGKYFSVASDIDSDHLFDFSGSSAWWNFFKLKLAPEPVKRYFIVDFSAEAPNGRLVVKSVNLETFGNFGSRNDFVQSVMTFYPELTNIFILSISELSETDYKQFYGEEQP